MQNEQRRKQEIAIITYQAPGRTFDRLFKEESLQEIKEAVRRKLGLSLDSIIKLEQLREGNLIDLEDDDDFEALRVFATTASSLNIRVTVSAGSSVIHPQQPVSAPISKGKRRQSSAGHGDVPRSAAITPTVLDVGGGERPKIPEPKKKRRHSSHSVPTPSTVQDVNALGSDVENTADQLMPNPPVKKKNRHSADFSRLFSASLATHEVDADGEIATPSSPPLVLNDAKQLGAERDNLATAKSRKRKVSFAPGSSKSKKRKNMSEEVVSSEAANSSISTLHDEHADPSSERPKKRVDRKGSILKLSKTTEGRPETQPQKALTGAIEGSKAPVVISSSSSPPLSVLEASMSDGVDPMASQPNLSKDAQGVPPKTLPSENWTEPSIAAHSSKDLRVPAGKLEKKGPKVRRSNHHNTDKNPRDDVTPGPLPSTEKNLNNTSGTIASSGDSAASPASNFAQQLAGVLTKASDVAREHMSRAIADQKTNRSKKKTAKQTKTSDARDVVPKKDRNNDPNADSSLKLTKSSWREEPDTVSNDSTDYVAFNEQNGSSSHHEEKNDGAAAVKAAMSRALAKRTGGEVVIPNNVARNERMAKKAPQSHNQLDTGKPFVHSHLRTEPNPPSTAPTLMFKSPTASKIKKPAEIPCPVCLEAPFHIRYQCPTILAGPDAIRIRIRQLKQEDEARQMRLIRELETMIPSQNDEEHNFNTLSNASDNVADASLTDSWSLTSSVIASDKLDILPTTSSASEAESRDESNSNESADEDGNNHIGEQSSGQWRIPTSTNTLSYAEIDLDAVIRGPATSRPSVDDILSEVERDEDDEEHVVLEEDDDSTFRRLSKRLAKTLPRSDSDGELDPDSGDEDESSKAPSTPPILVNNSEEENELNEDGSSRESGISGESLDVDRTGDAEALPDDTAIAAIPKDDSQEDVVAPTSAESDVESNAPPSQPCHEATIPPGVVLNKGDILRVQLDISAPVPAAPLVTSTDAIDETEVAVVENEHLHTPLQEPSHRGQDDDDPIEPADDIPESPVRTSSRISPLALRGRGRNKSAPRKGKTSTADVEQRSEENGHAMDDRAMSPKRPEEQTVAPRTRATTRAALESAPSASPNGLTRSLKMTEGQVHEAAEKLALKKKNGRTQAENSPGKARAKTKGRAKTKAGPTPRLTRSTAPKPSSPLLSRWTTLETASQDPSIDQLQSSPNGKEGNPNGKAPKDSHAEEQSNDTEPDSDEATPLDPLFILSQSQVPVPHSKGNDNALEDNEGAAVRPTSTSESEVEVQELTQTHSRTPTYRSLTDIASQRTLFTSRPLTPASLPRSQMNGQKTKGIYDDDEEEDDDDEEDSGSDSDQEISHIPKGRRAGAGIRTRR